METHAGKPVAAYPGKIYRLNWAQTGGVDNPAMRALNTAQQISIFVGDVPAEATDQLLEKIFRDEYGDSVINARVVVDLTTGRSKGFGFVRFTEEAIAQKAIQEMQGKYILNRRMRLSGAAKKPQTFTGSADPFPFADGSCTVYIGNLAVTSEEELKSYFLGFGDITRVKIIDGKSCAFVDFFTRASAETAISQMNGAIIGGMKIRMSWGHTGSAGGPAPPKLQIADKTIYEKGAFVQANMAQQQQLAYDQMALQMAQTQAYYMEYMKQLQMQTQLAPSPELLQEEPELDPQQRYVRARLKQFAMPALAPRLSGAIPWL